MCVAVGPLFGWAECAPCLSGWGAGGPQCRSTRPTARPTSWAASSPQLWSNSGRSHTKLGPNLAACGPNIPLKSGTPLGFGHSGPTLGGDLDRETGPKSAKPGPEPVTCCSGVISGSERIPECQTLLGLRGFGELRLRSRHPPRRAMPTGPGFADSAQGDPVSQRCCPKRLTVAKGPVLQIAGRARRRRVATMLPPHFHVRRLLRNDWCSTHQRPCEPRQRRRRLTSARSWPEF